MSLVKSWTVSMEWQTLIWAASRVPLVLLTILPDLQVADADTQRMHLMRENILKNDLSNYKK